MDYFLLMLSCDGTLNSMQTSSYKDIKQLTNCLNHILTLL